MALDGTVMSVEVSGTKDFQAGVPKPLFKPEGFVPQTGGADYWDAGADGQKFVFAVPTSTNSAGQSARFTVVQNWQALLKK